MTTAEQGGAPTSSAGGAPAAGANPHGRKPGGFAGAPWYVISRVAAAAIAFGTLYALTRVLDPADYGVYSLIISSGTLTSTLVFGWIYYSLIRFYDAADGAAFKPGNAYGLLGAVAAVLAVATAIVWLVMPSDVGRVVALTAAYSTGLSFFELTTSGLRVRRRPQIYAMAIIGKALLATGLGVALVLAGGGAAGAILGAITATLLFGFAFSRTNIADGGAGTGVGLPGVAHMRNYAAYGMPLALAAGGMLLLGLTSRGLIAWKVGLEAVGYFAAAELLCHRTLKMLMQSVTLGISVEIYKAVEQHGDDAARAVLLRYASVLILVSAPLFAVLVLAPNVIANVFVGGAFAPTVAQFLPWLAFVALVSGAQASYLSFAFLVRRKSWPQLVIFTATFTLNTGLALLLLPRMGLWGAVIATASAWSLSSCLFFVFGRRWFRLPAPWLALRKMLLAIAPAVPLMIWANTLENVVVGMAMLTVSGAVVAVGLWVFDYPEVREQVSKVTARVRRRRSAQPSTL